MAVAGGSNRLRGSKLTRTIRTRKYEAPYDGGMPFCALPPLDGPAEYRRHQPYSEGLSHGEKRGKGSHPFLYRHDPPQGLTIPDHAEIGRGTLRAIIRQAGLTVELFRGLLD